MIVITGCTQREIVVRGGGGDQGVPTRMVGGL